MHAGATAADDLALCELDGPRLPFPSHRLNLEDPDAPALRHTVTCPGCRAWMHA